MSKYLKPGQHPDADALSAFADNALPAHEREGVLLHLAECEDCRAIVYLAEEIAVVEAPPFEMVAEARAVRKPWFAGWRLVWPVGALACAALITVYLQDSAHRSNQPVPGIVAANPQAEISNVPGEQAQLDSSGKPLTDGAKSTGAGMPENKAASRSAATKKQGNQDGVVSRQQIHGVGGQLLSGRSTAGGGIGVDDNRGEAADKKAGEASGYVALKKSRALAAPPKPTMNVSSASATLTVPAAPAVPPGQILQAAQSAPAMGAAAVEPRAETKSLEAPSVHYEANAAGFATSEISVSQQQFRLPSHLGTASAISNERMVLAIDTAGTLFASRDSGKHWKAVAPSWTGRAVSVNFAPAEGHKPLGEQPVQRMRAAGLSSARAVPQNAPVPANALGAAALTGLIIDPSGAVIPGTTVTAVNEATAQSSVAKTDSAGRYVIQNLAPGAYTVEAAQSGFKIQRIGGVQIKETGANVQNITLQIGAAAETVEVSASSNSMQTESAELDATINGQIVTEKHRAVFELTTDSGETWVSADGRHWNRK